ncbi:hypothetical protein QMZ05_27675 [Bradyrhizobium sp. INPA03-11B]|uniref:hypothetical protein n=1 Tax=Bradyrhizobium sp. INPA03-11B TaxID=418598 RepID=UPI00338E3194
MAASNRIMDRYGYGRYLGYLQWEWPFDGLFFETATRRCDIYGDGPSIGQQRARVNLNSSGRYEMTWFAADGATYQGICVLPKNVADVFLALNPTSINLDTHEVEPTITLIEWLEPPAPPAPPDAQQTIGVAGGSTSIRVNIGATINHATPVSVTLSADYVLTDGAFPRPIGTPAHGTIVAGATVQLFEPEAAALVGAGAAAYA